MLIKLYHRVSPRRCITVKKLMAMNVYRGEEKRYLDNSRNRLGKLAQLSDRYIGADRTKHDKRYCKYNYYHQTFSNRSWVDQSATVDGQPSVLLTPSMYHWTMLLAPSTWWARDRTGCKTIATFPRFCDSNCRRREGKKASRLTVNGCLTSSIRCPLPIFFALRRYMKRSSNGEQTILKVAIYQSGRNNEEMKYETASGLLSLSLSLSFPRRQTIRVIFRWIHLSISSRSCLFSNDQCGNSRLFFSVRVSLVLSIKPRPLTCIYTISNRCRQTNRPHLSSIYWNTKRTKPIWNTCWIEHETPESSWNVSPSRTFSSDYRPCDRANRSLTYFNLSLNIHVWWCSKARGRDSVKKSYYQRRCLLNRIYLLENNVNHSFPTQAARYIISLMRKRLLWRYC